MELVASNVCLSFWTHSRSLHWTEWMCSV